MSPDPRNPHPTSPQILSLSTLHQSGTFVTADEPTLTHHRHPKSVVPVRIYASVVVWQMYIYCLYTEQFRSLKKFSALSLPPFLPATLFISDLFTISIALPFLEHHTVGIIRYAAFSEWVISSGNMDVRFIHVFSWLYSSVIFSAEYYSMVGVQHGLFIHSPTEGPLSWFWV